MICKISIKKKKICLQFCFIWVLRDVSIDLINIDFLCLSETWHKNGDYLSLNEATPPGYKYFEKARNSGRGGGLALIYLETFATAEIRVPDLPSFECLAAKCLAPEPLLIVSIYRPPKANKTFISDFSSLLTTTVYALLSPGWLSLGNLTFMLMPLNAHWPQTSSTSWTVSLLPNIYKSLLINMATPLILPSLVMSRLPKPTLLSLACQTTGWCCWISCLTHWILAKKNYHNLP